MARAPFRDVLRRRRLAAAAAAVVIVSGLAVVASRVLLDPGAATAAPDVARAIDELRAESDIPVEVAVGADGVQAVLARVPTDGDTPEARARDFIADYRALFGVADTDLQVIAVTSAVDGADTVRFQQVHRGIAVHGAQLTVTLQGDRALGSAGRLAPAVDLEVTPVVVREDAERAALDQVPDSRVVGTTSLVIHHPELLGLDPASARLAWLMTVAGSGLEEVFVDALDATILARHDLIHGALALEVRSADNRTSAQDSACYLTDPGTAVATHAGIDPAFSGDADAVAVVTSIRATHDWFQTSFGRDSYDGAGTALRAFVHARFVDSDGFAVGNAHWIGGPCGLMEFSDGFVAQDIVTHEFTHAVIEHTADLEYVYLSGALNESYADVFAFLQTGDPVMGEGLPGGAVRDLANPSRHDQPDRMSELRRPVRSGGRLVDSGWVHYNSGIPNHAAFLLARGGAHPDTGVRVEGLGDARVAQLYYASLAGLNATSDLIQQRVALQQAVFALGGSATELCAVRNAMGAIEVGVGDADCDGRLDPGDEDGDFVIDRLDSCRSVANSDQRDRDADGVGDACDERPDEGAAGGPGLRIVNLFARPGERGYTLALTTGRDEPFIETIPYGQISRYIQPPRGDDGQPAYLFMFDAADPGSSNGMEVGAIDVHHRVTVVVQGFNLYPWARQIWESEPPPTLASAHVGAWPEPPSGKGVVMIDPGPLADFGGVEARDWWFGVDGACLIDAVTGKPLDDAIGGAAMYGDTLFAFLDAGSHQVTASRDGCDGSPAFQTEIDVQAATRLALFPFGTGIGDLAFQVLEIGGS